MFHEGLLDRALRTIKRFIPRRLFAFGATIYHPLLAWTGALRYGFPSRKLTVIGITGTKGKSTTVYLTAQILQRTGRPTAAIGSLGYQIKEKTWPNTLKMTMPGRWKVQKFLRQAADAGCRFVVLECPSEGLAQGRHLGVRIDAALFNGLHPEHIEAHGSLEAYRAAKQILFKACKGIHIVNADDPGSAEFLHFPARKHITYGINQGDIRAGDVRADAHGSSFRLGATEISLRLSGVFNVYNALAAIAVADAYGIPASEAKPALEGITEIPGRMQWIVRQPYGVVVDYAHTPDSLRAVYGTLRSQLAPGAKLIAILGAAGGGRDRWKRKEFGAIAAEYCDHVILTNEDPFEEDPEHILQDIRQGIPETSHEKFETILDRKAAIGRALTIAQENDIVIITGKGSETSMALAGGRKIAWSDAAIVGEFLHT